MKTVKSWKQLFHLFQSKHKNIHAININSMFFSTVKYSRVFLWSFQNFRSSHSQMFFKISVLKYLAIFPGKHLCLSLFLIKLQTWGTVTLLKRDSTQVFSCEYYQIFKNAFFTEHPRIFQKSFFTNHLPATATAMCWKATQSVFQRFHKIVVLKNFLLLCNKPLLLNTEAVNQGCSIKKAAPKHDVLNITVKPKIIKNLELKCLHISNTRMGKEQKF